MQRNFEPMWKQVEARRQSCLTEETVKLIVDRAFVEGELEVPKHLTRRVHDQYFNPTVEELAPRTLWSLFNTFTSAFKDLEPIPRVSPARENHPSSTGNSALSARREREKVTRELHFDVASERWALLLNLMLTRISSFMYCSRSWQSVSRNFAPRRPSTRIQLG
jgi:hypothetical protein